VTTDLERFNACMQYRSCDRRPNHELGAWAQTRVQWQEEAAATVADFTWDWFVGEKSLGMDQREYIPVNFGFLPGFTPELLEETEECEIRRNGKGIVTKALKEGAVNGARMCMDQYLSFPVTGPDDFAAVKERLLPTTVGRHPADLRGRAETWKNRDIPLVLGRNCAANGFFWRARELMGTEALCFAWYDHPDMMHEMMEFYADFIIETSRPVLEEVQVDYFCLNEDLAMKNGPLLSPDTYRTFILPHLKRLVAFFRSHGTRHFVIDSDGDPTPLIPLMLEAGVDTIWPIERASNISPQEWRKQFGKDLRLWGGVDKRILPRGPEAVKAHLREFIPLIEEGGFIPTVDHTVQPGVSWDDFRYYMDAKQALLEGRFAELE